MKKSCGILLLALLLCLQNVSLAEQNEDSLNISQEEWEILQPLEGYPVYKIYRENIMLFFGQQTPIGELTEMCTEYLYKINDGSCYAIIENGHKVSASTQFSWYTWDSYVVTPEVIFGPEIEVYNLYCFDNFGMWDPVCIYYVTNKGDYVLIAEFAHTNDIHLFPADVFYQFTAEVYEIQQENKHNEGTYTILDIAGIEEYVLNMELGGAEEDQPTVPPTEINNDVKVNKQNDPNVPEKAAFDWVWPVAVCVVAVPIVGVAFAVPVIKRKKSQ